MNRFEENWDVIKEYMRVSYRIPNEEYARYIKPLNYRGFVGYTQIIGVPEEIEYCIPYIKEQYYTKLHRSIIKMMYGHWSIRLFPESDIVSLMYSERDKQMRDLHIEPELRYAWENQKVRRIRNAL